MTFIASQPRHGLLQVLLALGASLPASLLAQPLPEAPAEPAANLEMEGETEPAPPPSPAASTGPAPDDAAGHRPATDRPHGNPAPEPEPPDHAPRLWPVVGAVVPGVLVHGSGHLIAGETDTGLRLLALEGVGLGAAVVGVAGLAVTGASPRFVGPLIAVSTTGGALFAASALADLYGVVAPPGGFGRAVREPALVLELGPRYVDDRVFAYDALGYVGASAWLSRFRVEASGFFGLDHANQRLRALGAYRLLRGSAASYLDVELASTHHRFGPERFSMTFFELAVAGRLELQVIGRTLQGAFFECAFGYALGMNRQFDLATESDEMLLARFGMGFFVGEGGEVVTYYDHRHDDYAAGLKLPGLGSGPLGHVGVRASHYFTDAWGASAYAETGSAHVLGVSLLFRRRSW
ncbi:MAG: hypothetical protein OXT09_12410 [Myxococcales bacterium]|nr:hypothetical protein [Myxococcales bacterium]